MKQLFLFIFSLLTIGLCNAQVGVNTNSPLGVFHIDPLMNTTQWGGVLNNDSDDFIITNDGKVGIGTASPSTKLDLRGKVKYVDGTERQGYILTTDANGFARWAAGTRKASVSANEATGLYPNGGLHDYLMSIGSSVTSNVDKYMKISITVPPGIWQVSFVANYGNASSPPYSANIIWSVSKSSTFNTPVHTAVSGTAVIGTYCQFITVFLVNQSVTTTYYMWARSTVNGVNLQYAGEGWLWAIPVVPA